VQLVNLIPKWDRDLAGCDLSVSLTLESNLKLQEILQEREGLIAARFNGFLHLARLIVNFAVHRYAGIVLQKALSQEDFDTAETWFDCRKSREAIIHEVVDHILDVTTMCIYPHTKAIDCPLNATYVGHLVWPISLLAEYPSILLPEQRVRARRALYEIGTRAKLPAAVKIAKQFDYDSSLSSQSHILHLS
jgi:hypothetical protein